MFEAKIDWWFQPSGKKLAKFDPFPKVRVENKKTV